MTSRRTTDPAPQNGATPTCLESFPHTRLQPGAALLRFNLAGAGRNVGLEPRVALSVAIDRPLCGGREAVQPLYDVTCVRSRRGGRDRGCAVHPQGPRFGRWPRRLVHDRFDQPRGPERRHRFGDDPPLRGCSRRASPFATMDASDATGTSALATECARSAGPGMRQALSGLLRSGGYR